MTINIDVQTIGVFFASASTFFAGAMIVIRKAIAFVIKITPYLKPVIEDAENRARDHLIDCKDRKAIAMNGVKALEESGEIKLNIMTRFVVSKIVDDIARNLPDFTFNNGGSQ